MNPQSARQEFLRYVTAAGCALNGMSCSEGIQLMLGFYREVRADGCRTGENGDMLLYQWQCYEWSRQTEIFDLDITRQFILCNEDEEEFLQLSLTFRFKPTATLRQAGSGNRWCHSPEELEEFKEFIIGSPAYMAAAKEQPSRVDLEFDNVC